MGLEATSSGKVSAAEVSTLTFEAIAAKHFYVFSHPGLLSSIEARMRAIIESRNPPVRSPPGPKSARRSARGCATLDKP
jgi:hypothetical protein